MLFIHLTNIYFLYCSVLSAVSIEQSKTKSVPQRLSLTQDLKCVSTLIERVGNGKSRDWAPNYPLENSSSSLEEVIFKWRSEGWIGGSCNTRSKRGLSGHSAW